MPSTNKGTHYCPPLVSSPFIGRISGSGMEYNKAIKI